MDKAKTNLGHGQRLDKLWTKFGQTLDKDWTLRPEFVRPLILQEHPDEDGFGLINDAEEYLTSLIRDNVLIHWQITIIQEQKVKFHSIIIWYQSVPHCHCPIDFGNLISSVPFDASEF